MRVLSTKTFVCTSKIGIKSHTFFYLNAYFRVTVFLLKRTELFQNLYVLAREGLIFYSMGKKLQTIAQHKSLSFPTKALLPLFWQGFMAIPVSFFASVTGAKNFRQCDRSEFRQCDGYKVVYKNSTV